MDIDWDTLYALLDYNNSTGIFTWKVNTGTMKANTVAGGHKDGYIQIGIQGKRYRAHRLAWFYEFGKWPDKQIDHIDGIRDNNAIINLREATNAQNNQNRRACINSSSKVPGVSFNKENNNYRVRLKIN